MEFLSGIFLLFLVHLNYADKLAELGENCTKTNGVQGTCKIQTDCANSAFLIQHDIDLCEYDQDGNYVVCCDHPSKYQKAIEKCSEYSKLAQNCDPSTGLVFGGQDASIGEFPHAAALGLINNNGERKFGCGGSLISERFIVTASHCFGIEKFTFARLGYTNISSTNGNDKGEDHIIEKFIRHPNYGPLTLHHDIALVKLVNNVTFTKKMRPACLYYHSLEPDEKIFTAIGWGITEYGGEISEMLQKVELNFFKNRRSCETTLNRYLIRENFVRLLREQICAKGRGGKDTCSGDSGGALEVTRDGNQCVHHILGITSYGLHCGYNIPAVFTKIHPYIEWIQQIVWP